MTANVAPCGEALEEVRRALAVLGPEEGYVARFWFVRENLEALPEPIPSMWHLQVENARGIATMMAFRADKVEQLFTVGLAKKLAELMDGQIRRYIPVPAKGSGYGDIKP